MGDREQKNEGRENSNLGGEKGKKGGVSKEKRCSIKGQKKIF